MNKNMESNLWTNRPNSIKREAKYNGNISSVVVRDGKINVEDIDEQTISNHLYTNNQPDPDLLIRTSGEVRLSNFLTWQLVYTEFLFIEKNWPDFSEQDLEEAIEKYQSRNRKFGAKWEGKTYGFKKNKFRNYSNNSTFNNIINT